MNVRAKDNSAEVQSMRIGSVFRMKGDYYMVTDMFYGEFMHEGERAYINLKTGFCTKIFVHEKVQPINDIELVVGE